MNGVKETGQPTRVFHLHHTPHGDEHVEVEAFPINDADGNLSYFLEVIRSSKLASSTASSNKMVGRSPAFNRVLELVQGSYIQKAEPILMVGNPGLGKTHVATGMALAACRKGYKVRFYNAAGLVNELILAQEEHRLSKLLVTSLKQHLIVLDELGFIPFSATGAQLMFQFCSALYERVAMIVTTNLHFANWIQVFGDEQLTAALLDRLTHHAHILEFVGESYRFRERVQREVQEEVDA